MKQRGRKRAHQPSIPAHIDQAALPRGLYWDASGSGRWFVIDQVEGRPKRRTVAHGNLRLSELHTLMEARVGIKRGTLGWLLDQFHDSPQFRALAPRTRGDYDYQRELVRKHQTKGAGVLADIRVVQLTRPFIQRVIDAIAASGTPTKAAHLLRYLRRTFRWGQNRGHCADNPAAGVEQPKLRNQRRLPDTVAVDAVIAFARERGARKARTEGACAPYLWIVIELAYLCRLRGIEVATLTDAHATDEGVLTNRRKGSRDNVVRWSPRLRAAWDAAVGIRAAAIARRKRPVQITAEQRALLVTESGTPLAKSSIDTAWQRLITAALKEGVITPEQRFSPHDLKRKGVTDTPGTRADKQDASGHRSASMLDVYDHSVPVVDPSQKG